MTTKILLIFFLSVCLAGILPGCKDEAPPSLYDPNNVSGPQPKITNLVPASGGLAGVTKILINGTNFSSSKEDNFVFFDATLATVLQASPTQLQVSAPNIVKDSIKVKIAVKNSDLYSDQVLYKLEAAVVNAPGLGPSDEPWGTAIDTAGNLYVSVELSGIKKVAPGGTLSDYAPASGFAHWTWLKVGPDGKVYGALNLAAVFEIRPGTSPAIVVGPTSGIGKVYALDFDPEGNIWAVGNNPAVYRVNAAKDVKAFPLNANIRSVRVYSGFLYFAGNVDSLEKVFRCQILSGDSLGPKEDYFNFSNSSLTAPGKSLYALNFAANGDLLLGTDLPNPLIVVHPSKIAESFYPDIISPTVHILVWGKGTTLYAVRGDANGGVVTRSVKLLQINPQVSGAL